MALFRTSAASEPMCINHSSISLQVETERRNSRTSLDQSCHHEKNRWKKMCKLHHEFLRSKTV